MATKASARKREERHSHDHGAEACEQEHDREHQRGGHHFQFVALQPGKGSEQKPR
jgi:hypothetical protein